MKYVYRFSEGSTSMADLLGGKGANLADMVRLGLPVPPGFTISTEACRDYYRNDRQPPPGLWDEVLDLVREVEQALGRALGAADSPLLVSVRSGARYSMPGMMDTVLNLGLNDETVEALARETGDRRFALDSYRRFVQMFAKVVLRLDPEPFEEALAEARTRCGASIDAELDEEALAWTVRRFQEIAGQNGDQPFPSDPREQLRQSVLAVFGSWNSRRAIAYRRHHGIPDDLCTAVNIQAMVFGNRGWDSGTGVAFSRSPATGERRLYGEYLANAQGEDIVSGARTPKPIEELAEEMPKLHEELAAAAELLERHHRDIQDIEFTIESGKLYILQTRSAKRTAAAAVKAAVDMADEGMIDRSEALRRVPAADLAQLLLPRFPDAAKRRALDEGRLIGHGLSASPGAATGRAVFDAETAAAASTNGNEPVVLVRRETSAEDVHGIIAAAAVLTSRGGVTSHAAVVTRGLGKPAVVGCAELRIEPARRRMSVNGTEIHEGDLISVDGFTGEVFAGAVETVPPNFAGNGELAKLMAWADETRRLGVRANADTPTDARLAIELGAEGIGLCRTEHMFFQPERLPLVRAMLTAAREVSEMGHAVEEARQLLQEAAGDARAAAGQRLRAAQERFDASSPAQRFREALERLAEHQRQDFADILRAMDGRPVTIRLLDAPLHEFLPPYEVLLQEVAVLRATDGDADTLAEKEKLLETAKALHEINPMMGHRGCRLGLTYPDIYEMQVRAIVEAARQLRREGLKPRPEIMIPMVADAAELRDLKARLQHLTEEADAVGEAVPVHFGTMIELPRAALTAGELAPEADFFSFGSNDLTQMTFGFSRDDAEEKFLRFYISQGLLPANPFHTLDETGVGRLIAIAVEEGRRANPRLQLGLCGEHGGDPTSIRFCHDVGLDYVSCSPLRLPIARLAAAQATRDEQDRKDV